MFRTLVVGTARISTLEKRNVDRLHDRKPEHFKGTTSTCHASAVADHVTSTGHNVKMEPLFEILAKGRSDTHCKIKETSTNSGTQTYPERYCQQRKALSVLVCIFLNANFC